MASIIRPTVERDEQVVVVRVDRFMGAVVAVVQVNDVAELDSNRMLTDEMKLVQDAHPPSTAWPLMIKSE